MASALRLDRCAFTSVSTAESHPLGRAISAYLRERSWTILAEEADPPRRFGRRHLGKLPGSTHTSLKMVRESEETASEQSGCVREVDAPEAR